MSSSGKRLLAARMLGSCLGGITSMQRLLAFSKVIKECPGFTLSTHTPVMKAFMAFEAWRATSGIGASIFGKQQDR